MVLMNLAMELRRRWEEIPREIVVVGLMMMNAIEGKPLDGGFPR
jgi:hypothetical protein